MAFKTRWSIEGTLTTTTPLHIGAGESALWDLPQADRPQQVEVAAIARDHRRRPYIPGTSLKGVLRAWLANRCPSKDLLGSIQAGGKAEFWDAPMTAEPAPSHPPPHWDSARQCGVEVGVAIDRATRTASDRKLFHQEAVPTGAVFGLCITGIDLDACEVAWLLAALDAFNHPESPLALGADTVSGKGRCTWSLGRIRRMGPKDLKAWLAQDPLPTAEDWMPDLSDAERLAIEQSAAELGRDQTAPPRLRLGLRLVLDGPFLVNDPPRTKDDPEHRPRRDANGNPYLPAKSLRGALRSQAERILRTLGRHACRADDPTNACRPVQRPEQRTRLCLACQAFGAAGWRSPLHISDFTLVQGSGSVVPQELIAIDRSTGGGAEHLKFNIQASQRPTLTGTIAVELDEERMGKPALGLLALTLCDLAEGDITLGLGAAKGYGGCRARVTEWALVPSAIGAKTQDPAGDWPLVLDEAQRRAVLAAIEALRNPSPSTTAEDQSHG